MDLDNTDQKLLNRLQIEFPLTPRPYWDVGMELGLSEDEIMRRVARMRSGGIIRQIGPLLDAKKINYKTTLVAMRVTGPELEKAVRLIEDYPVSHAYERDHHYNFWFTLALPASLDVDEELKRMISPLKVEACFSLPAVKLFKLRVYFNSGAEEPSEAVEDTGVRNGQPAAGLSDDDRRVLNAIQQDIPLISRPYEGMAKEAGMTEDRFLEQCESLLSSGVIRRISVAVNHHQVGFVANGMACWVVPAKKIDQAGERLASLREVSHCYERRTNPLWKHNLFAMIHGKEKEECRETADKISTELGLTDGMLLFSTREFRKTRLRYPV